MSFPCSVAMILNEGFSHQSPPVLFGYMASCKWLFFLSRSFGFFMSKTDRLQQIHLTSWIGTIPYNSPIVFFGNSLVDKRLSWKMAPSVICAICAAWLLRLRVEQWISPLSLAERWETHHGRFEELLGRRCFVRCGFFLPFVYQMP